MWCPGSGVVLDCIDSLSLPPYLLSIDPKVSDEMFETVNRWMTDN